MFRWSYIIPRLLLLTAMLLFLQFGLGPVVRWGLIAAGQAAVGSRVEMGTLVIGLGRGELSVRDVAIANPRSPLRNAVQFEQGQFTLNQQALLQRRFVVDRGVIHGLRFDTTREVTGELDSEDAATGPSWVTDQLNEAGEAWLEGVAGRLDQQLEDELETVRLGKELADRWPREYARLEDEVGQWRGRIEQFRQLVQRPPSGNVLEQAEFYKQRAVELEQMRRDVQRLREDIQGLGRQAQHDRLALDAARRRDEEHIRRQLRMDQLDPEKLSALLLDEESSGMLSGVVDWLQRGRQLLNVAGEAPEWNALTGRGQIVSLATGPAQPDFLVRHLHLDGSFLQGGREVAFRGTAEGLTHQPDRYAEPAVIRLETEGDAPSRLEAQLDYRGDEPRQRLRVHCPRLPQPQRLLGKRDQLALQVAPGQASMVVELELVGQNLTGQVAVTQETVQLTSFVGPRLGGELIASRLQQTVGRIQQLDTVIHFQGPVTRPTWRLRSNLGGQLADGLQGAMQQELASRADQLRQYADTALRQQLGSWEQLRASKEGDLLRELKIGERQVAEFQQSLARRAGLPRELLGRESPLKQLFR